MMWSEDTLNEMGTVGFVVAIHQGIFDKCAMMAICSAFPFSSVTKGM